MCLSTWIYGQILSNRQDSLHLCPYVCIYGQIMSNRQDSLHLYLCVCIYGQIMSNRQNSLHLYLYACMYGQIMSNRQDSLHLYIYVCMYGQIMSNRQDSLRMCIYVWIYGYSLSNRQANLRNFVLADIDECALQLCSITGTQSCEDLVNDFSCLCKPGYTGNRCQNGKFNIYVKMFAPKFIVYIDCIDNQMLPRVINDTFLFQLTDSYICVV